jgi:small subunit ribosomal protein S8e
MAQWHLKSKRTKTGGLLVRHSKKKKHQQGRDFLPAHVGENKKKTLRTRGGNSKTVMLAANVAVVSVAGKAQKTKILSVVENAADSQYVRRNIITKGAIINTELGKARVTSRPGQNGVINAVLFEDKKVVSDVKKK